MEGEVSMAWSENEKNVYEMGNDREGVGVGGGHNKLSRVFNNLAKKSSKRGNRCAHQSCRHR